MKPTPTFKSMNLSPDGLAKCDAITKLFEDISKALPAGEGRAGALAQTKLEEACFWAKKSVALAEQEAPALESTLLGIPSIRPETESVHAYIARRAEFEKRRDECREARAKEAERRYRELQLEDDSKGFHDV